MEKAPSSLTGQSSDLNVLSPHKSDLAIGSRARTEEFPTADHRGHRASWIRALASQEDTPDIVTSQTSWIGSPRHSTLASHSSLTSDLSDPTQRTTSTRREEKFNAAFKKSEDVLSRIKPATSAAKTDRQTAKAATAKENLQKNPNWRPKAIKKPVPIPVEQRVPSGFIPLVEPAQNSSSSRCSGLITLLVVLIGFLVAVFALFCYFISRQLPHCTNVDSEYCARGGAECEINNHKTVCECIFPDKVFVDGQCKYSCEHDPIGNCSKGVCHTKNCYADVLAFLRAFHADQCTDDSEYCNTSCEDLVSIICPNRRIQVEICHNPEDIRENLRAFECQRSPESKRFKQATALEAQHCLATSGCVPALKFLPCLAGYINQGSVQCKTPCKATRVATKAFSIYGYCVNQETVCDSAMTDLMFSLNKWHAGYSYDGDELANDTALLTSTMVDNSIMQWLTYPLMLAYVVRYHEYRDVPVEPFMLEYSATKLSSSLQNPQTAALLRRLYPKQKDIIDRLTEQAEIVQYVYLDRLLRVAAYIIHFNCSSLSKCPPSIDAAEEIVNFWASNLVHRCLLAGAFYFRRVTVNDAWFKSRAKLRQASFLPGTISVIYSESFVSKLAAEGREFTENAELTYDYLNSTSKFCSPKEPTTKNKDGIVLSLPLYRTLWGADGLPLKPIGLARFAVILAETPSLKSAICGFSEPLPTVKCEVSLFLAFSAFMPDPSPAENELTGSADKTIVYFILRAMMRVQIHYGTRPVPFNLNSTTKEASAETTTLAQEFVTHCVGIIDRP